MDKLEQLGRKSMKGALQLDAPDFAKFVASSKDGSILRALEERRIQIDPDYALFKMAQMTYNNRAGLDNFMVGNLNKARASREDMEKIAEKSVIDIPLQIGQRTRISTMQSDWGCATIDDMPIYPWRNIQLILEYSGDINTEGHIDHAATYPKRNALERVDGGLFPDKYVFKTNYPKSLQMKDLPTLSQAVELSQELRKQYTADAKIPQEVMNKVKKDKLLDSLAATTILARDGVRRGDPDFNVCNDFEALITKYNKDGHVIGDCKCYSTLIAGIADSLGLAARTIYGNILDPEKALNVFGELSNEVGHVWTEVYVPKSPGKGFWAPVDPFNAFIVYPKSPLYLLDNVEIPQFLNPKTKKAYITIDYV